MQTELAALEESLRVFVGLASEWDAKPGVLIGDCTGVGLGTPAELAPVDELLRARRTKEHSA
jgi:hypothetical protein